MDFNAAFARFLDIVEQDMQPDFQTVRDQMIAGRWVALTARFDLSIRRKLLGVIPTKGTAHSHELCLFLPVRTLDAAALEPLLDYFSKVHDTQVQLDPLHEFTMLTLVLASASIDRAACKRIRRHRDERRYEAPGSGWSSARVLAADLENRKICCNKFGQPAADRLRPSLLRL